MNNIEPDHFSAALENLLHDVDGLLFALGFVDALHLEIGLAMLHDQVNELLLVDDFKQLDDVFLVDVFEDVNLVLQG